MSENSQNFLEQLKQHNLKNAKPLWIPSLQREIKFQPLTAKHQKYLIDSALSNPIFNVTFVKKVYQILKELCEEPEVIDTLSLIDKDAILIQMRYHFIKKTYDDKDFTENVEFIKTIQEDFTPQSKKLDDIEIQFRKPNVKDELNITQDYDAINSLSASTNGPEEIKKLLTDMYILELVKNISTVIIHLEQPLVSNFLNQSLKESMTVVDHLGKNYCDVIHQHVKSNREKFEDMYKIDDETSIEISIELFN